MLIDSLKACTVVLIMSSNYIIFISSNSEEHFYTNHVEHDSIVVGFRQNMYSIQTHTKKRRKETYNGAYKNKD